MSTEVGSDVCRINLRFYEIPEPDLLKAGIHLDLIRLVCDLRFATSQGWADVERAIIDTGAPVSMIPRSIWRRVAVHLLSPKEFELYGISTEEQEYPSVPARLGVVECTLLDESRVSPPLRLKAYLMPDDATPLALGFEGLLTRCKLVLNYPDQEAFLLTPMHDSNEETEK
jgi:hypothetical protein